MINIRKIIVISLLLLMALFILFPIAWMFVTSVKPDSEVFSKDPTWFPVEPTIEAYDYALKHIGPSLLTSVVVSTGSALLTIGLTVLSGYALARFEFSGKRMIFIAYTMALMFPKILVGVPVYVMFSRMNLLDTSIGLILIYSAAQIPVAAMLLRSFFYNIPRSIEEAAMIDGCSRFSAFLRVVLPLSLPGLAAASLFSFVTAWNDVLYALILTLRNTTMSVEILHMVGTYAYLNWPGMMAAAVLGAIPPILIFLFMQKAFVSGLTAGALKG